MDDKRTYWYEMTKRPVSIGCQPRGFVDINDNHGKWGIVAYNRELTQKELDEYEMRVWSKQ